MPITVEPISAANKGMAEQMLRDYSIELDPDDYDGRETAHEAELQQWLTKLYDEAITNQRNYWLAYNNGELIGFVVFRLKDSWWDPSRKYGQLNEFYILPSARGHGAGRELAELAFAAMQRQGAGNIELGVITSNTQGLAFWQSLGFTVDHYVLKMPLKQEVRV